MQFVEVVETVHFFVFETEHIRLKYFDIFLYFFCIVCARKDLMFFLEKIGILQFNSIDCNSIVQFTDLFAIIIRLAY